MCQAMGIPSHTEDVGFGVIINKAAINVHVQAFLWTYVFISLGSPVSSNGRNSLISISCYCLFSHKIVKGRVASSAKNTTAADQAAFLGSSTAASQVIHLRPTSWGLRCKNSSSVHIRWLEWWLRQLSSSKQDHFDQRKGKAFTSILTY